MDVSPDDPGAGLAEGDGGGTEGIGGDDDLITGPDAAQRGRQTQRVGGIVHGEGVPCAGKGGKVLLELRQITALSLALHIAHHVHDGSDLFLGIGMLSGRDGDAVAGYGAPSGRVALHNLRHILVPPAKIMCGDRQRDVL